MICYTVRPLYHCQLHSPVTLTLSDSFPDHSTRQLQTPATLPLLASFTGHSTLVSFFHRPLYPCQLHSSVTLPMSVPLLGHSTLFRFSIRYFYSFQIHFTATLHSLLVLFTHEERAPTTHRIRAWVGLGVSLCILDKRNSLVSSANRPRFLSFTAHSLVIIPTTLFRLVQLIQSETFQASVCGSRSCQEGR